MYPVIKVKQQVFMDKMNALTRFGLHTELVTEGKTEIMYYKTEQGDIVGRKIMSSTSSSYEIDDLI